MKWFRKHLNLTWLIVFLLLGLIDMLMNSGAYRLIAFVVLFIVDLWIIGQKNRSKLWLIPTFLLIWLPLVLTNKTIEDSCNYYWGNKPYIKGTEIVEKPTVSDLEPSQTSVVHRFDGCNETDTHSDKTGDI